MPSKRIPIRIAISIFSLTAIVAGLGQACTKNGFQVVDLESQMLGSLGFGETTISQPELKPLTPREYDQAVKLMLGLNQPFGSSGFPIPNAAPFDNDASQFTVSKVHVDSYEFVAIKVADAFLASPTRASYIPCTAASTADRSCLEKFAIQLATLGYRRPVTALEVKPIVDLAVLSAQQQSQFQAGLKIIIQVILQDPQFLYRFETGAPTSTGYQLGSFEFLSKATFFVLGLPPTLAQIQEVAAGALDTPEGKEAFIQKLLDHPDAASQMDLFHAYWMGYAGLGGQSVSATDFRTETKALVSKVLTGGLPWRTVLTSKETYSNGTLAKLYDLDDQVTTGWKWRAYKGDLRQGLLSQGSFLSVGVKFGDTSTTRRGYNIQKALFCGHVGRPPTVDENGNAVDIDMKPPSDVVYECKEDLYRNTVLSRPNCASCHKMMDTIGFGLENFAADASYRTTETGKPNCTIRGQGEAYVMTSTGLTRLDSFNGPKQLADLVLRTGYVEKCMAKRILEFSLGRQLGIADEPLINKVNALNQSSADFKSFLKSYLLSPEFVTRRGI